MPKYRVIVSREVVFDEFTTVEVEAPSREAACTKAVLQVADQLWGGEELDWKDGCNYENGDPYTGSSADAELIDE